MVTMWCAYARRLKDDGVRRVGVIGSTKEKPQEKYVGRRQKKEHEKKTLHPQVLTHTCN
jgi:hypothetical protein